METRNSNTKIQRRRSLKWSCGTAFFTVINTYHFFFSLFQNFKNSIKYNNKENWSNVYKVSLFVILSLFLRKTWVTQYLPFPTASKTLFREDGMNCFAKIFEWVLIFPLILTCLKYFAHLGFLAWSIEPNTGLLVYVKGEQT